MVEQSDSDKQRWTEEEARNHTKSGRKEHRRKVEIMEQRRGRGCDGPEQELGATRHANKAATSHSRNLQNTAIVMMSPAMFKNSHLVLFSTIA